MTLGLCDIRLSFLFKDRALGTEVKEVSEPASVTNSLSHFLCLCQDSRGRKEQPWDVPFHVWPQHDDDPA